MLHKSQFNVPHEDTLEYTREHAFASGLPMVLCYDFYVQYEEYGIPAFAYGHDGEQHYTDVYYDDPSPSLSDDACKLLRRQVEATFEAFITDYLDNTYDAHSQGDVSINQEAWCLRFDGIIEIRTYEDFEHTL